MASDSAVKIAIPEPGAIHSTLDWKAYFHKFVEAHGEPIRFDGRLLFRDGWGYAMNHAGPEFPPPDDPKRLKRLRRQYWDKQLAKLTSERDALNDRIKMLIDWGDRKSLPLQERRSYPIKEGSPIRKWDEPQDLDVGWLKSKLAGVDYLVSEAVEELEELQ